MTFALISSRNGLATSPAFTLIPFLGSAVTTGVYSDDADDVLVLVVIVFDDIMKSNGKSFLDGRIVVEHFRQ